MKTSNVCEVKHVDQTSYFDHGFYFENKKGEFFIRKKIAQTNENFNDIFGFNEVEINQLPKED